MPPIPSLVQRNRPSPSELFAFFAGAVCGASVMVFAVVICLQVWGCQ